MLWYLGVYIWFLVQLDLWIHPKHYSKSVFAYRTDVLQQAVNRRITRPSTSVKLPIFHGTFSKFLWTLCTRESVFPLL
jgi:hypothetical protein